MWSRAQRARISPSPPPKHQLKRDFGKLSISNKEDRSALIRFWSHYQAIEDEIANLDEQAERHWDKIKPANQPDPRPKFFPFGCGYCRRNFPTQLSVNRHKGHCLIRKEVIKHAEDQIGERLKDEGLERSQGIRLKAGSKGTAGEVEELEIISERQQLDLSYGT